MEQTLHNKNKKNVSVHGKQSPSSYGQTHYVLDEFWLETKPVEAVVEVIDEPYSVYESIQQNEVTLRSCNATFTPHVR